MQVIENETDEEFALRDPMLYELRMIRRKMSAEGIDIEKINANADRILKEYGITLRMAPPPVKSM